MCDFDVAWYSPVFRKMPMFNSFIHFNLFSYVPHRASLAFKFAAHPYKHIYIHSDIGFFSLTHFIHSISDTLLCLMQGGGVCVCTKGYKYTKR